MGKNGKRGPDSKHRKKRAPLSDAQKRERQKKIKETKRLSVGQPRLAFAGSAQVTAILPVCGR